MILSRKCPDCNTSISYKNKYNYQAANDRNTKCRVCSNLGKNVGNKHTEESIQKISKSVMGMGKTGKDVECFNCGKLVYKSGWELKPGKNSFCSIKCRSEYQTIPKIEVSCSLKQCSGSFYREARSVTETSKHYCDVYCSSIAGLEAIQCNPPKMKRTKPEMAFMKLLEDNNIEFKFQKSVQWVRGWKKWFDFYIPKHNLLIEIDGVYWHGKGKEYNELNEQQKQTKDNDILKNELAKESGYNLMRIWSDEINKFNINKII